jgi:uncharacterized SAM-binding protein YcdF (DUF218 family)
VALLFYRLLGLFFLLFLVGSLAITFAGQYDNLHVADLAVVLGSKVRADGQPSEMLRARLNHTAELYREGYFKFILVSGGRGKEGYDYLEAKAVPHESIFEDDEGYTTWQTAQNTAAFLRSHHLKSVLIISQYFHIPRCRLAFAKFRIEPVYWSHAPFWSLRDFYSVPREVIGTCAYSWRHARQSGASMTFQ